MPPDGPATPQTPAAGRVAPASEIRWPRFPYPGLRPFRITPEADESLIFRGRNSQRDDVLERLDASQFVSVVGPSGCGKSSLVKVGIIPVLEAGLLTRAGYDWRAVQMRPGHDPLGNLAAALATLPGMAAAHPEFAALLATKRSGLWLVMEQLAERQQDSERAGKPQAMLLLLDQFEEIFSGVAEPGAVDQFVALMTQFFRNPHPQLFVVLTMRTDFISQCANFPGLAELLNKTAYITPVLRGRDLVDAIEQPAAAYGGAVEPALVRAIVHDMGAGVGYDADHLPLMQHALLWLWQHASAARGGPPPQPAMTGDSGAHPLQLTLADYEQHGRLHGILSRHADQIFSDVTAGPGGARRAAILESMFRRLSERDASARYKRAPAYAQEVCRIGQCTMPELDAVVAPFAQPDVSFVERRPGQGPDNALLDLSHESLIRQWVRLRGWADAEADTLATFREVAGDAADWDRHGRAVAYLKTGGQLGLLEDWWQRNRPSAAWAARYSLTEGTRDPLGNSLASVEAFRTASLRERTRVRRVRLASRAVAVLLVVLAIAFYYHTRLRVEQEFRVASIKLRGEGMLDDNAPDRALQLALRFLDHAAAAAARSEDVQGLAYRALWSLYESRVLRPGGVVSSVDLSPDGVWLLAVASQRLRAWTRAAPTSPMSLDFNGMRFWRAMWNPHAAQVLLLTADRALFLVPVRADAAGTLALQTERAMRLGGPQGRVGAGVFSADGQVVVTGGSGAPLRVWDAASGTLRAQSAATPDGFWLAPNADGSLVAMPSANGGIDIYQVNGSELALLPRSVAAAEAPVPRGGGGRCSEGGGPVRTLAFDPHTPNVLLFAAGCHVHAVDALRGVALWQLHGHHADVSKLAFNADGSRIVTGTEDGVVRLFDRPADPGPAGAELRVEPRILGKHESAVMDLRFSPDGRQAISAGRDGTLRVWNLEPALAAPTRYPDLAALRTAGQAWLTPLGLPELDALDYCLMGASECRKLAAAPP